MLVYPLFLRLSGRSVLVVGAGSVGTRKIRELCEVGANVRVVALQASPEVEALATAGTIKLERREFLPADLDDVWLVVAATNDPPSNRVISEAADARRVFCNAVDDPPNASAFFGSVIRRPPFLVAISSSGETPALSRLLREMLDAAIPEEHWIEKARALRRKWKDEGTPMGERFGQLVQVIAKDLERGS